MRSMREATKTFEWLPDVAFAHIFTPHFFLSAPWGEILDGILEREMMGFGIRRIGERASVCMLLHA